MRFFLIFLSCALNCLSASQHSLREELDSQYVNTQITSRQKISEAHHLITKTLLPYVFPCLPDSHRWVKEGNEYVVKRYQDAKEHDIEFVVFADHPLSPSVVNYLTMVDGRNVQSYAHTRPKTFQGKRDSLEFIVTPDLAYPSLRGFTINKRLIDGHCIDHADTIYPESINKVHSSKEPRNHLAESDWGLYVRRELVASIRSTSGSYMQMPYYSANPLMTSLATPVPLGVHFFTFQPYESHIYNIHWDASVCTKDQGWRNFLYPNEVFSQSHGYLPSLYGLEGENGNNWNNYVGNLRMNSSVYQGYCYGYDVRLAENLKIFADIETETIATKIRFLYYSYLYHASSPDLSQWHKRALRHADLLLECEKPAFSSIFDPEAQYVMRQISEDYYDHWRQVLSDQQDLYLGKRRGSSLKLKPPLPANMDNNVQHFNAKNMQSEQNNHPYHLRSNPQMFVPTITNPEAYVVTFGQGKGSRKQVENNPIENIKKILTLGKLHLMHADKAKVDTWLEVNRTSFMQLNRDNIPVFYSPSTTSKSAHQNIEQALRRAGFTNIAKR